MCYRKITNPTHYSVALKYDSDKTDRPVVNAKGVKGPKDIHKLREFLGWDEPELDKVNTDEEEKKYKIGK